MKYPASKGFYLAWTLGIIRSRSRCCDLTSPTKDLTLDLTNANSHARKKALLARYVALILKTYFCLELVHDQYLAIRTPNILTYSCEEMNRSGFNDFL